MHFAPLPYLEPGSGSLFIQILLATLLGIGIAIRYAWSKAKERIITMSTNTQRIVVFVIAAVVEIIMSSLQGVAFGPDWLIWTIVFGIVGIIIYEIMLRTQDWVRLITLPIYGVLYLIIRTFVGTAFYGIWYQDSSVLEFLWRFDNYSLAFTDPYLLINGAIVVVSIYYLISGNTFSIPLMGRFAGSPAASEQMAAEISDDLVTRLLCAAAITNGAAFRKKVLDRVENQYVAVAPEFGVDLELVARVCQFIEHRETKFQIAFFIAGLIGMMFGLVPMIILTAPIMFIKKYNETFDLLKYFTDKNFDREEIKRRFSIQQRSANLNNLPTAEQNLVVYNGFLPFVGAGYDLGGWSFALDITRPKNELGNPEPVSEFDISELYEEIETACRKLDIPSLRVSDLCFVNGLDIRNDRVILPQPVGRPIQCVDNEYLKAADDFRIRQYKHISVSAWGNDIIFSIFLRCTKRGKNLFVEAARYLLPPIDNQYRNLSQSADRSWSAILGIAMSAIVLGPINGYLAWLFLFMKFMNFLGKALGYRDRRIKNEIKKNPNFNYGITTSLRQEVTGALYLHYFQKADREMFVKILDNEILETLISFFNEHNIDTSQLRERQTTIANTGIIVQGGNIESQSIAVGAGAKSITSQAKVRLTKE